MTMTTYTLPDLADQALDAFWQVIAQRFPEAKTGDLSIDRTLHLHAAAEQAIEEWIANNVPDNFTPRRS